MLARSNPEQKSKVVFPELQLWFRDSSDLCTTAVRTHPNDELCIFMSYRLTHYCKIHESSRRKVTSEAVTLFSGVMSHMMERIKAVLTCTVHGNTLSGSGGGPHLFWS